MPAVVLWGGVAALALMGFKAGEGTMNAGANLVKWSAIAGGVYIGGKAVKAW